MARNPEKILADDPGSVVFSRYAEQLARDGQIEQAVEVLKRGIQANPFHAPGYSVLAELLFQLESEEEAVENIVSALRVEPQMPRDMFRLGMHYLEHEPSLAVPLLKSVRVYEPESEDVAVAFERIGLLTASDSDGEQTPADQHGVEEEFSKEDTGIHAAGITGEGPLPEDDFQDSLRKITAPVNQEDKDFLALMGEDIGVNDDDAFDALFQPMDSKEAPPDSPSGNDPDEIGMVELPEAEASTDGSDGFDLTSLIAEAGGEDLDDAAEDAILPADELSFDLSSLDMEDGENALGEDADAQDLQGEILDQEAGANQDILTSLSVVEDEEAEDDLDALFHSLARGDGQEAPLSEGEVSGTGGGDVGEIDSAAGIESGSDEADETLMDTVPGENIPLDYGIVDFDREEEEEATHTIDDDEEYDLARFGFDATPEEELPVLSEAERSELMALTVPRDSDTSEDEDGFGLGDLSLEDLDKPDDLDEDYLTGESGSGLGEASSALQDGEDLITGLEGEELADEGIGYSDIISSWKLPGDETVPSLPMESESLSISDILDSLEDDLSESAEQIAPLYPQPEDEPEQPVTGVSEIEETGEPEILDEDTLSVSEPGGSFLFEEDAGEDALSVSDQSPGGFSLAIPDVPADSDDFFHPLTEEQASLIDDFISGKELEPEPDDAEIMDSPQADAHSAKQAVSEFYGGTGAVPEEYHSIDADQEQYPLASDEIETYPAYDLTAESEEIAEPADHEESLDELIGLYQAVLKKPASFAPREADSPVTLSSAAGAPKPLLGREREPRSGAASRPLGSYTATMAEIYVSQGLITRAMEIYTVLVENNAENEQYRLRLTELKRLHEQQPEAS